MSALEDQIAAEMGEETQPEPEPEPQTPAQEPQEPQEPTEPGEPGEATPGTAEPATAPEGAPEGLTQKEIESRMKKLETASNTFLKKVVDVLGDDYSDFVPVPLSTPFLFGHVFRPDLAPIDEEQARATKQLLGVFDGPQYASTPDARECDRCEGWGKTLTGSKVGGAQTITCTVCRGRGWTGEAANVSPEQAAGLAPVVNLSTGEIEEPQADEDEFGTPRGHPDYGKMLQYRSPSWRQELDAWKAGQPAPIT